jgi:hypothetical protein
MYLYSMKYDIIPVPEFIDPRFRENKPKTLVFSHRKRAFWACFGENCVYNFGHGCVQCTVKYSATEYFSTSICCVKLSII